MHSPSIYIEFGHSALWLRHGDQGLDLPLERQANGRLTDACKERVATGLRDFLKRQNLPSRVRAWCGINARGVSARRLTLPASNREEMERLLPLQIESEFPLSPDELAWGYRALGAKAPAAGGAPQQEVVVIAVKKEVVREYAGLLSGCGLNPVFTLAALARNAVCPSLPGAYSVLAVNGTQSELISYEGGNPASVRVLSWGEASVLDSLSSAVEALANRLPGKGLGERLYLVGRFTGQKEVAAALTQRLGGRAVCEAVEAPAGPGNSAATLGLRRMDETGNTDALISLQGEVAGPAAARSRSPAPWKWAIAASVLLVLFAGLPYVEALVLKPSLARTLERIKSSKARLSAIDREYDFLQFLKNNQSPYLDTLYLLANNAPPGSRFDAITMSHQGDLSLRGTMQNSQQVTDLRSKLNESGLFSSVVVAEQNPTPDRQRLTVRITAQWKPVALRKPLPGDKPAQSSTKSATNAPPGKAAASTNAPPAKGSPSTNGATAKEGASTNGPASTGGTNLPAAAKEKKD
ncbi:MAG TPA: hypothetical protein VHH73_20895 [Verrucomicrobiae bacterium]|nr:hypothetical protein [Verrucomicrobiae bacterium]